MFLNDVCVMLCVIVLKLGVCGEIHGLVASVLRYMSPLFWWVTLVS